MWVWLAGQKDAHIFGWMAGCTLVLKPVAEDDSTRTPQASHACEGYAVTTC